MISRFGSRDLLFVLFIGVILFALGLCGLHTNRSQRFLAAPSSPSRISCTLVQPDANEVVAKINGNTPSAPAFSILDAWLKSEAARFGQAPQEIPPVLVDAYTLNGQIPVSPFYFDQAYLGDVAFESKWTVEMVDDYRTKARARQDVFNYPNGPLYDFFDKKSAETIAGKRGLVIGSEFPWLEAMLLEFGASQVETLEFGKIYSLHPQIKTHVPGEFTKKFLTGALDQFDFAFSYSSLEHDGLGRYGDILNPQGDLLTMAKLLSVVKPGGFVMIGVPCCHDRLDWNAHRIYGPLRLPLMFSGYTVVSVHPALSMANLGDAGPGFDFQPVWVLQNTWACENTFSLSRCLAAEQPSPVKNSSAPIADTRPLGKRFTGAYARP